MSPAEDETHTFKTHTLKQIYTHVHAHIHTSVVFIHTHTHTERERERETCTFYELEQTELDAPSHTDVPPINSLTLTEKNIKEIHT